MPGSRPPRAPERHGLDESLEEGLSLLHVAYYHTRDSRQSAAGFPDYVLRTDPTIAFELKAEGAPLSIEQGAWLRGLAAGGTIALLVVGPSGVGELLAILQARKGTPPMWSRGRPVALGEWRTVRLARDYGGAWPADLLAGAG